MTLWQAIVLGVVQGLTEFLPISSTAHLRIVPALLGWNDPGAAFTAVIQLGTLVAVLLYFSADILSMTRGVWCGLRDGKPLGTPEAKMGWMIAVGTIPVVIFGLALVLAVAEWAERRRQKLRGMDQLGWLDAIVVGFAQCVALIPGSSRSGCTITGGLFLGMTRETAARFSFLLSLPAVFAAGIFELHHARHELLATQQNTIDLAISTLVSFVVGYASIAFLLGYLKKHTTWLFIIYRLALGAILFGLLASGRLQPL